MTRPTRLEWLIFLALGFAWGSSYLFIKIGVEEGGLPPLTLIALRLGIGFAFLATVVAVAREPLPREPRMYGHLLVMAYAPDEQCFVKAPPDELRGKLARYEARLVRVDI